MAEAVAVTAIALTKEPNAVTETLRERGYEVRTLQTSTPTPADLIELLGGTCGIIAGSELLSREVLEQCPNLRVISRNGVGYDAVDLDAATDLGIVVAYVPDAMVEAVADLALGLLLAVGRRISECDAAMKRGEWLRVGGADVSGRTLGLVGTGRIGMAVARRARAFNMRLIGYDPYPNPLFLEELGGNYGTLDEVLEAADFVTLHVPLSASTRTLIGAVQLRQMKRTAYLINTARGALVDEQALYEALQGGEIAGAALDVFSKEPPDPHPLWSLPNVVATPHVAAFTPRTVERMGRAALANLLTALEGQRPEHVANPAVYERPGGPRS